MDGLVVIVVVGRSNRIESNPMVVLLVANERKEGKISKYSLAFRSFIREENRGITTTMTLLSYEPTARLHSFTVNSFIHSLRTYIHSYIHTRFILVDHVEATFEGTLFLGTTVQ